MDAFVSKALSRHFEISRSPIDSCTAHLQLDDVVRDGGAAVALRQRPVEVAVVGPPVQDVGPPGLGRLVCTREGVDIRC